MPEEGHWPQMWRLSVVSDWLSDKTCRQAVALPTPLTSWLGVVEVAKGLVGGLVDSLVSVEVDDERLKVLARGARCVSLSSAIAMSICL